VQNQNADEFLQQLLIELILDSKPSFIIKALQKHKT